MKTTIELPDELARRAKQVARDQQMSLKDLVAEGLRAEIERATSGPMETEFRFRTVSGSGLRSDVSPRTLTDRAYDLPS